MKIRLIACEVLTRELCLATAESRHVFDISFLSFGLHATPNDLRATLQSQIDEAEGKGYDYIVLGYGLCSRGTAELVARSVPIVIPRGHDCITMLLGSMARYDEEFREHPGTYYYSAGWIERSEGEIEQGYVSDKKANDNQARYLEYVEKYGEDNAKFLLEQEQQWLSNYTRAAFINAGIGAVEDYREFTQRIAASHNWDYTEVAGDMSLVNRIASADWNGDDFLIVQPGQRVVETFDARIIAAEN